MNGDQLTAQFHVDYIKALHRHQYVLDNVIKGSNKVFGNKMKLKETSVLVHKYLGLMIDFSLKGKLVFIMFEFLEYMIF